MSLSGGDKGRKRGRPHPPVTSPLEGEVGVAKRRREGGKAARSSRKLTPLPNPPPRPSRMFPTWTNHDGPNSGTPEFGGGGGPAPRAPAPSPPSPTRH